VTENPARLLGIFPRKGVIAVGADADFAILDDQNEVVYTVVGGEIVYVR
jgi:N-acetylglucosamine-6-phosphate deacetylase